jgi:hypothetical protein
VLIALARYFRAAPAGFTAKLLLSDEGKRGTKLLVLDDRCL